MQPAADGGRQWVFKPHALFEMARRQISEDLVRSVLDSPQQLVPARAGRIVFQSKIESGDPPAMYLLRVFVDVDRSPAEVVTAYRTSKIEKYWRLP
jgi:hypothetical protein